MSTLKHESSQTSDTAIAARGCASCCKPRGQSQQQAQFINVDADKWQLSVTAACNMI